MHHHLGVGPPIGRAVLGFALVDSHVTVTRIDCGKWRATNVANEVLWGAWDSVVEHLPGNVYFILQPNIVTNNQGHQLQNEFFRAVIQKLVPTIPQFSKNKRLATPLTITLYLVRSNITSAIPNWPTCHTHIAIAFGFLSARFLFDFHWWIWLGRWAWQPWFDGRPEPRSVTVVITVFAVGIELVQFEEYLERDALCLVHLDR